MEFLNKENPESPIVVKGFRMGNIVKTVVNNWGIMTDMGTMTYSVDKPELAKQCFKEIIESVVDEDEKDLVSIETLTKPIWKDFINACKATYAQKCGDNLTWCSYRHPTYKWRYFKVGNHENTAKIVQEVLEQRRERIIKSIEGHSKRVDSMKLLGSRDDQRIEYKA
jgi:hypothetical protein|tara:strand:+ start:3934 stop:4434 length:501 start_codon:yes stop_codon:yes gene_type:complete